MDTLYVYARTATSSVFLSPDVTVSLPCLAVSITLSMSRTDLMIQVARFHNAQLFLHLEVCAKYDDSREVHNTSLGEPVGCVE